VLVPDHVQAKLLPLIWQQANEADWDHLSQADKARLLESWIAADAVGGVLRPLLLTDAAVRLWLKDVAIKKRARARMPSAATVVAAVLPPSATVIDGSEGIKPHHCRALLSDGQTAYLCWGAVGNAKHLYWAALTALMDDQALGVGVVVFVDFGASSTARGNKRRLEALAQRCGVEIRWLSVTA
jgi:hypothetical protein